MTVAEVLKDAMERLRYAAERPRYEAEILLAHHLGCERATLLLRDREELADPEAFFVLVERRAAHEPVEYITGRAGFYSEEFHVAPGVLIPRPETELLVDEVSALVRRLSLRRIAEIGVGSGAVSVTLARLFPRLEIVATDISLTALEIARLNAERFGVADRVEFRHASLLEGVGEVELICSNPPYVAEGTPMAPNVAEYEPPEALYAPGDGTTLLRKIVLLVRERRVPVVCEMGYDQREAMEAFFADEGIEGARFYRDLAGMDRGFVVEDDKAQLKVKNEE